MKTLLSAIMVIIFCVSVVSVANAAEKETFGMKCKKFWQGLFNYSANVTQGSANVVSDTGKKSAGVVTQEVKRVGEVTSGELGKTKELIEEPVVGMAETVKGAVEETVKIPFEATKEAEK